MAISKSGCIPWALGAVAVCVGLMILGANAPHPQSSDTNNQQSNRSSGQDKISSRVFEELTPGVTRQATVQSLVDEGEQTSSSNVAGLATQGYVIRNSDGSTATLIFQNGILAMKSQNGLY